MSTIVTRRSPSRGVATPARPEMSSNRMLPLFRYSRLETMLPAKNRSGSPFVVDCRRRRRRRRCRCRRRVTALSESGRGDRVGEADAGLAAARAGGTTAGAAGVGVTARARGQKHKSRWRVVRDVSFGAVRMPGPTRTRQDGMACSNPHHARTRGLSPDSTYERIIPAVSAM